MVRPRRSLPAVCAALVLLVAWPVSAAAPSGSDNVSGGALTPERAAYDVLHYDLSLDVDPDRRRIDGSLVMTARWVAPTPILVLDLDHRLEVKGVGDGEGELRFERAGDEIRVTPRAPGAVGDELVVRVDYGGEPRVARRPPWEGGFTWSHTADGSPWIATSCQMQGADLWWPCKDHPSDEPESMDLHITVPESLVVASNGRLVSVEDAREGWHTYHWRVSTPINNYGVALNIAPYETVEGDYTSTAGDTFHVTYWVLPENLEHGRALFQQILQHLRFFEELFGPYPFRADKYGVAETPHLGMEHQTIIAYGNHYRDNEWGFDWLHHHELAHEWFANLVTAVDWNDFWLHEGFATYAQPLYVERLHGPEAYRRAMLEIRHFNDRSPVAPRGARTAAQVYFGDGGRVSDNDIYYKGAWILHTLRWLFGDEAFFRTLRRMAYPDPALESTTDGRACRFATTEDFRRIAEKESGRDLGWFFEAYLRRAELPRLDVEERAGELHLRWEAPGPFPMPVEVLVDGVARRVDVPEEGATLRFEESYEVDPREWLLRAR